MTEEPNRRRPALRRAAFRVLAVLMVFMSWFLFIYPKSPLTDAWNPFTPLDVQDAFTPLTHWKLTRALASDSSCLAALESGARAARLPDFQAAENCHIRPQVNLSKVGGASVAPFKTRCQTALRLAMWERHGIQRLAQLHLGQGVSRITHFSSYNCRQMRTSNGGTGRMSTHATADAIDISGFVLRDGTQVRLKQDWDGSPDRAAFLRDVRDSACNWFRVTLSPDYNTLHADHFHLQHTGWGLCR